MNRTKKCPTCDSTAPHLHPAMQHEGEVQPCRDKWHEAITPENKPVQVSFTPEAMKEMYNKGFEEGAIATQTHLESLRVSQLEQQLKETQQQFTEAKKESIATTRRSHRLHQQMEQEVERLRTEVDTMSKEAEQACACVCHRFPEHGKLQDALEAIEWHQKEVKRLNTEAETRSDILIGKVAANECLTQKLAEAKDCISKQTKTYSDALNQISDLEQIRERGQVLIDELEGNLKHLEQENEDLLVDRNKLLVQYQAVIANGRRLQAEVGEALKVSQPIVCSVKCPSVRDTNTTEPWPHHEDCVKVNAAIAAAQIPVLDKVKEPEAQRVSKHSRIFTEADGSSFLGKE